MGGLRGGINLVTVGIRHDFHFASDAPRPLPFHLKPFRLMISPPSWRVAGYLTASALMMTHASAGILVNLDATGLPVGPLPTWSNAGSLGGSFSADLDIPQSGKHVVITFETSEITIHNQDVADFSIVWHHHLKKKAPKDNLRRQVAERGTVKRVRGSGPVPLQ